MSANRRNTVSESPSSHNPQEGLLNGVLSNAVLIVGFIVFAYTVTFLLKNLE